MPTVNIHANSADGGWANYPDPNWAAVNSSPAGCVVSNDGGSSYLIVDMWAGNQASPALHTFDLTGVPNPLTITSLIMVAVEGRSGGSAGNGRYDYSINGGASWSTGIAAHGVLPDWTQTSGGAMSRPGGGTWTRADLANLRVRCYRTDPGPSERDWKVTQIYVQVSYTASGLTPTVSAATNVIATGATLNGNCPQNGDVNAQRYFEWGTASGSYSTGNSGWAAVNGATSYNIGSLTPGQTYYFRMRGRTTDLTEYNSSELSFVTAWPTLSPTVTPANGITGTQAVLNGHVDQLGDTGAERYFEWGTATGSYAVGNSGWAAVNGNTSFAITGGLTPAVRYFFRMRARNSGSDEFNSEELSFLELPGGIIFFS